MRTSSTWRPTPAWICCSATWTTIRTSDFLYWAMRCSAATYGGPAPVPLEEIADFAESWILPPNEQAVSDYHLHRRLISSSLRHALYTFSDLGIFSQTENEIALTAWGDVFVSAWLSVELPGSDDDR